MAQALTKVDRSPLTPIARKIAAAIIQRLPAWILPNHITGAGFGLYLLAGVSLYLASFSPRWFMLAALCIFMHWITDNLDGELARARNLTSQRGFFLDLFLDTLGGAAIATGLGLAAYTVPQIFLLATTLYLLSSVLVLFRLLLLGEFQIPLLGPAEIRLMLILLALASFMSSHAVVEVWGLSLSWFDLATLILIPINAAETLAGTVRLYRRLDPATR